MKVKSQVMSNIVRMLENEGPFKDVIYVILENVSKYLKMPDVTVMQYDEERTCLYPVLSYGGRHHLIQAAEVQAAAAQTAPQGTVERQVKAAADSPEQERHAAADFIKKNVNQNICRVLF